MFCFKMCIRDSLKIRKSADKHFEGLAALSTHSVGRRVTVKVGCKPVHFSLDGSPLSCYFSGRDVYKRQVLQTGEDIGVKHIIADIVHGALACALPVLATMIMAVRLAVLPVLPIGPVSYTHLDVYKRQPHGFGQDRWKVPALRNRKYCHNRPSLQSYTYIALTPVSYTHLDVYKRQI